MELMLKWKVLLEQNLASRDDIAALEAYHDIISIRSLKDEVHAVYDIGNTVVVLALKAAEGGDLFFPALYVAEKKFRRIMGRHDSLVREYPPLRVSGLPNFDRAIRSAMDLSIRLSERPKKCDLPKGVMVAPDRDHYLLFIGMVRISQSQLDGILSILSNNTSTSSNEEQPATDTHIIEDTAPEGEQSGDGVEVGKTDSQSGGEEGGLVPDPTPDTSVAGSGEQPSVENTGEQPEQPSC